MQLGNAICYQYESAYFPRLTRITSNFAASAASHTFNCAGLRLAVGGPTFAVYHKNTPETISEGQKSKIFPGGMPQDPS